MFGKIQQKTWQLEFIFMNQVAIILLFLHQATILDSLKGIIHPIMINGDILQEILVIK